ncbi:MAG: carbohydrate ABC transporter substrate-binding protein [Spirochaetes bacterium]|nr:MAG: carbohydrate ABC transporter substrate-binding protein [Spirochaetota bacterium]RKX88330.1 MAG: carbohydrate ABC transporter substrate-binding protein [Spirochaetota bacterium]
MNKRILFTLLLVSLITVGTFANGGSDGEGTSRMLVINSNLSDPAPKAAFAEVVEGFKAANPDIEVTLNSFDHEAYKTAIRNFLASDAPDVCLWFAGNRMKFFVDEGLFLDISDVWSDYDLNNSMSAAKSAVSVDGKQYGVPWGYYQWGMFYRKDIFDKYGLSEPATWDEFLEVGETLKSNGITPVAIGTKYLWTAGGWFDYLNLRVNGLDYHMDLMLGNASYTDPELDEVFNVWKDLIDRGFFLENHATYSWQEAQAPLINGDAAMYLIGNFIVPDMDAAGIGDKIGFFQFPQINSSVGMYEDAPMDTYHIPASAKNVEEAKLFLAYVASPEIQTQFAYATGNIPPNKNADPPTIPLTKEGFDMLAAADGLAQFYDRDTNPEMASAGMQGFQEFMVYPDREDEIRARIDAERKSVFDK